MAFHRPAGRTATLLGTLLMTTAFAVPALAQIETVTVTAEKRVEDIQTVPIAVTAYNAEDIAAHQMTQFKDLQFSTPNVTYTKGNFTGSNFQIRGIGQTIRQPLRLIMHERVVQQKQRLDWHRRHLALGDNHNAYPGGQNVSSLHLDGVFLNATLQIVDDGTYILKDGEWAL